MKGTESRNNAPILIEKRDSGRPFVEEGQSQSVDGLKTMSENEI
jgi:hypothetical protein